MRKILISAMVLISLCMLVTPIVFAAGYDQWGYNYQANKFNGWYENYGRPETPVETGEIWLMMKWNDAWMNEDKVRHEGYPTYDGSGAWLTNHMWGTNEDGSTWTYFVKIVTPSTAQGDHVVDGVWYTAEGIEIGYQIWGSFAVIQEFENNYEGNDVNHFVYQSSPVVGLGYYKAD